MLKRNRIGVAIIFAGIALVIWGVATEGNGGTCNEGDAAQTENWSVGVRKIHETANGTNLAIVFVHGLNGHYRCTFYNEDGETYWFDVVAKDDNNLGFGRKLSDFDIHSIDYQASFESDLSISELVDQVIIAVEASDIFATYDHIWFVTHSLGGIVTKQLLTSFKEENKDRYLGKVVGVSLLGVPSQGAELAEIFKKIQRESAFVALLNELFGPNSQIVEDLKPASVNTFLKDTEGSWRSFIDVWRREDWKTPRIYCAYESRGMFAGVKIVPALFTETTCDGRKLPANADHSAMVKPGGANGLEVHRWLRATIKEAFREWELAKLASYGGGEKLDVLVSRLQRHHRSKLDRWTGLPEIEFNLEYADDKSRTAAAAFDVAPKYYEGPSFLRILELIDQDYDAISISMSSNRRDLKLTVTP